MARYRPKGVIYQKEPEPWGPIIAVVIVLIVIGAAIG